MFCSRALQGVLLVINRWNSLEGHQELSGGGDVEEQTEPLFVFDALTNALVVHFLPHLAKCGDFSQGKSKGEEHDNKTVVE